MNGASVPRPRAITQRFIETVRLRLAGNDRVRRSLPIWGRIHIDRQLPFLCVYRRPARREDPGTSRLVTTEAAYLMASGARALQPALSDLVRAVAGVMVDRFGAFLLVEIWADHDAEKPADDTDDATAPLFHVHAAWPGETGDVVGTFESALARVSLRDHKVRAVTHRGTRSAPSRLTPVLSADQAREMNCSVLGLRVRPVYRRPEDGELYPVVLRDLRRGLSHALRQTFYDFMRRHTTHLPEHYQVLGRRATVRAVWEVDRQLAEVSDQYSFLLQVTPVNAMAAWARFQRDHFETTPSFQYRALTVDPAVLKRRLYAIPIERVEDPALSLLLRQKQDEIDREITMLADIDTVRFVFGSQQLFGRPSPALVDTARDLLARIPPRTRDDSRSGHVDAAAFAAVARSEIDYYRERWPDLDARVEIRSDTANGLMVSGGTLLISHGIQVPRSRVEALLQHEVGTHLVTYFNGRAQPLRQLYSGLAGYDSFQEGLAVLSEYLVGGLSRPRLRLLAARVMATRDMLDGATFVDVFRNLTGVHGFDGRTAYTITMRLYRGGGLTKDAVYLRGLCEILDYLGNGGDMTPLFVGKIAAEHVPIVRELLWRQVLRDPPLMPRYLETPEARSGLHRLRDRKRVADLIEGR